MRRLQGHALKFGRKLGKKSNRKTITSVVVNIVCRCAHLLWGFGSFSVLVTPNWYSFAPFLSVQVQMELSFAAKPSVCTLSQHSDFSREVCSSDGLFSSRTLLCKSHFNFSSVYIRIHLGILLRLLNRRICYTGLQSELVNVCTILAISIQSAPSKRWSFFLFFVIQTWYDHCSFQGKK